MIVLVGLSVKSADISSVGVLFGCGYRSLCVVMVSVGLSVKSAKI